MMLRPLSSLVLFLDLASSGLAQDLDASRLKKTRDLYLENCAACHGESGDGSGPAARAIAAGQKPRNFITEDFRYGSADSEIFHTITMGIPGSAMPPWKHLDESERWALVAYIRSLRPPGLDMKAPAR